VGNENVGDVVKQSLEDLVHQLANDVQVLLIRAGISRSNETHPVADATAPIPEIPVETPNTNS
jgi:hypothetical protein